MDLRPEPRLVELEYGFVTEHPTCRALVGAAMCHHRPDNLPATISVSFSNPVGLTAASARYDNVARIKAVNPF